MKAQPNRTVLAVDDDEINLMILVKTAEESGYTVKPFSSGDMAWEYLQQHPDSVDIALLDKMMPGMNGLELLRAIKENTALRHIPVILQTGDVGVSQMRESLESGAFYYLSKPFHPEILTAILHSAASECVMREELMSQVSAQHGKLVSLLHECEFVFKTHAEANLIAATIAQAATYPEFVAVGLMELLSNAIEHGNLEIGYDKKRQCLLGGNWPQFLAERAAGEFGSRIVHMRMERTPSGLHLVINDQGKGFDWRRRMYDDEGPLRLHEPNGRGIAKAMIMLDDIRYTGKGNEVHCNIGMPAYLCVVGGKSVSAAAGHN